MAIIIKGARACGKSDAQARAVAAFLKAGGRIIDGRSGGEIVGVPGYDDGRQITDKRTK